MTVAGRISPGCLCQATAFFKVIRSNTDINIRVNHEGLIHIHRSVARVLKGKIKPQTLHQLFSSMHVFNGSIINVISKMIGICC